MDILFYSVLHMTRLVCQDFPNHPEYVSVSNYRSVNYSIVITVFYHTVSLGLGVMMAIV